MKKVIIALSLLISAGGVFAQKQEASKSKKLSIGADIGSPVGDMGRYASLAFGGSLQAEFIIADKGSLTMSVGYLKFVTKRGITLSGGLIQGGYIPILAGGRLFFTPKIYGSVQLGFSMSTPGGGGAFTFVPGVGIKLNENFDLLAKYQSATKNGGDVSFIGVRTAYSF